MLWNWKHVYLEESHNPPVSFLFLRSPSLPSRLYFSESETFPNPSTTANTHFCQDLHIFSFFGSDLRSPYPIIVDTSHLILFVLTYPTHLLFVFFYNQLNILLVSLQLVSSHPTSSFVFFFFFPISFLYPKLLLTIGYPHSNLTINLQYTPLTCVFMTPAWKVRRGHLVIRSSVRPSVCLFVCLSVIPSRLQTKSNN